MGPVHLDQGPSSSTGASVTGPERPHSAPTALVQLRSPQAEFPFVGRVRVCVCECASVRVCECASVRVCQCASVPVCQCASACACVRE